MATDDGNDYTSVRAWGFVLPDPPGEPILPNEEVFSIAASAAKSFAHSDLHSVMPESWGDAYRFVLAHMKSLVASGVFFMDWQPPFGPDRPSPKGLHDEKVEWAWIHGYQFVQGAFVAASRYIEDAEARSHDQFMMVDDAIREMHEGSKPTYDPSQEHIYGNAMKYVLSRLSVETFESPDATSEYQEFLVGTVIGDPRPGNQAGPDIETAMVALGLVEGIMATNRAIAQGPTQGADELLPASGFMAVNARATGGDRSANTDSIHPEFWRWLQEIGGQVMLERLFALTGRDSLRGSVLYHAAYPNTRVMHALLVDRVLLAHQPQEHILGLAPTDDHPELDHILTSCLAAANDFADKHGEQLRAPDEVSPKMKADFRRFFIHRFGAPKVKGQPYNVTMGLGMDGPAGWAFYGWTFTAG